MSSTYFLDFRRTPPQQQQICISTKQNLIVIALEYLYGAVVQLFYITSTMLGRLVAQHYASNKIFSCIKWLGIVSNFTLDAVDSTPAFTHLYIIPNVPLLYFDCSQILLFEYGSNLYIDEYAHKH